MSWCCGVIAAAAVIYVLAVVSSHVKPTAQAETFVDLGPDEAVKVPDVPTRSTGESFDLLGALDSTSSTSISIDSKNFSGLMGPSGSNTGLDASTVMKMSNLSSSDESR